VGTVQAMVGEVQAMVGEVQAMVGEVQAMVDEDQAMVGEVQEMDEHDAVEPPSAVKLVDLKVEEDAIYPILMVDAVVVVVISAVY